jgi:hypothetical protein
MPLHEHSSSGTLALSQREATFNQTSQEAETIDLLRRACAVAETHTDAMGIVLMSTLPILACKFDFSTCIDNEWLEQR